MSKLALFGAAFLAATSLAHARIHHAAFHAAPPPQLAGSTALECSIVRQQPKPSNGNPVYKINVNLTADDSGKLESFDVVHTLRSGKQVDRSEQYYDASIWQTEGRREWSWKGRRGEHQTMVGVVYHNERDGWMYRETVSERGRVAYEMLADCHQANGEGD